MLLLDGSFLIVAGVVQLVSELLSHYAGGGLHGDTFNDSPYTIGFVEAHGLAAFIGGILLWAASQPRRRFFHGLGVVVHVFLAAANVVFWDSFREFGFVTVGAIATAGHLVFILLQGTCLVSTGRDDPVARRVES